MPHSPLEMPRRLLELPHSPLEMPRRLLEMRHPPLEMPLHLLVMRRFPLEMRLLLKETRHFPSLFSKDFEHRCRSSGMLCHTSPRSTVKKNSIQRDCSSSAIAL
jgi:hypothetical protein